MAELNTLSLLGPTELNSSNLLGDTVSYWRMENVNDSKGSNNLTNNGTATFVTGKFGNGLNLVVASSQYLSIADASQTGLDFSTTLSFSLWVKFASLPASNTEYSLITKDDLGSNRQYNFTLYNAGGTPGIYVELFQLTSSIYDEIHYNWTPSTGVWYHLAFTVNTANAAATEVTFYIDGVNVGNGTVGNNGGITAIDNKAAVFMIGNRSSSYFNGMIDDVGAFSRVLSNVEISTLYGAQAYWRFEDNANDSKNSNNLTLSGSPSYTTGKFGRGLALVRASSQYAYFANSSTFNSTTYSICGWFYLNSKDIFQELFSKDSGAGANGYSFYIQTDNKLKLLHEGVAEVSGTATLATGQWYQLCIVYNGTNAQFYINGSTDGSTSALSNNIASTASQRIGGWEGAAGTLDGIVDDVAYFNRALTEAEVKTLFNESGFPSYRNLLGVGF
jgi:hypothetical protein